MNRAIWKKAFRETWLSTAATGGLLLAFAWVFVWMVSQLQQSWSNLMGIMPAFFQRITGLPVQVLNTPAGQVSLLYMHVIPVFVCVGWALVRGSAVVSGEISRGTMDLTLTLPVRRVTVLLVPAVVTSLGAAVVAASAWAGNALGVLTVRFDKHLSAAQFLPGAVNLFAMVFCLTAITVLISACDRDRWRTIAVAGGLFILSLMLKMVSRLWPAGEWMKYLTFLGAYEPRRLILLPEETLPMSLRYNGTLLAVGLLCYLLAAIILTHRDIPAAH